MFSFILGIFVGVGMTLVSLWLGIWLKDASGTEQVDGSIAGAEIERDGDQHVRHFATTEESESASDSFTLP